jgi:hypothetical protein
MGGIIGALAHLNGFSPPFPLPPSILAHVLNALAAFQLPVRETGIGFALPAVTVMVAALSMFVSSVKISARVTSAETVSSVLSLIAKVSFHSPMTIRTLPSTEAGKDHFLLVTLNWTVSRSARKATPAAALNATQTSGGDVMLKGLSLNNRFNHRAFAV